MPDENLTLEELLNMGVVNHIQAVQEISTTADKQYSLERQLANMKDEWRPLEYEVKAYKNRWAGLPPIRANASSLLGALLSPLSSRVIL